MKNGLMGGMAKTREKHELKLKQSFLGKLRRWQALCDIQDRACKKFVNAVMNSGDAEKRWGCQKLRIFNLKHKVFKRCVNLVKAMETSIIKYTDCKS